MNPDENPREYLGQKRRGQPSRLAQAREQLQQAAGHSSKRRSEARRRSAHLVARGRLLGRSALAERSLPDQPMQLEMQNQLARAATAAASDGMMLSHDTAAGVGDTDQELLLSSAADSDLADATDAQPEPDAVSTPDEAAGEIVSFDEAIAELDEEGVARIEEAEAADGHQEPDDDAALLAEMLAQGNGDDLNGPEEEWTAEAIRGNVGQLASQIERLDQKFDDLRDEVRHLDESLEAATSGAANAGAQSERVAADFGRLGNLVEIVAGELKRTQNLIEAGLQERQATQHEIASSIAALDERLVRLETALLRVTDRVEGREGIADQAAQLSQRLDAIEGEVQHVQGAVEQVKVQSLAERADRMILAARAEAPSAQYGTPSGGFLSSLGNLMSKLRKKEQPEPVNHD